MRIKVIAIDDDQTIIDLLELIFKMNPDIVPEYELFTEADKLLKHLTSEPHICIIDYTLKGSSMNGLELIKEIDRRNGYCWFIIFSGQDDINVGIEVINTINRCKYIKKGNVDVREKLLRFIKELRLEIEAIELLFEKSEENRELRHKLKESLNDLKDQL